MPSIRKFSFVELTSNNDGKTSGSGTMGVMLCVIGGLGFIAGVIDAMVLNASMEVVSSSITVILIGASLLGLRKWSAKNDLPATTEEPTATEETSEKPLNS